jgi:hypothetical protein
MSPFRPGSKKADFYINDKHVVSTDYFSDSTTIDATKDIVWSVDTKTGAINQGDPSRIDPVYDANKYVYNGTLDSITSGGKKYTVTSDIDWNKPAENIFKKAKLNSTPEKDEFVVINKETGEYYDDRENTYRESYNARTFDTVHEALRFADNIKAETIVDKL